MILSVNKVTLYLQLLPGLEIFFGFLSVLLAFSARSGPRAGSQAPAGHADASSWRLREACVLEIGVSALTVREFERRAMLPERFEGERDVGV